MSTRVLLAVFAALSLLSVPFVASAATTSSREGNVDRQLTQSVDNYDHPRWNGAGLPPIDYMGN